jgi:N-acetylglutamate synthase-like GNAT family acetyltransferase
MELRPEPARPHDLQGALDLLRRCDLPDHGVAERFGHYFVIREDDGRVVGVAGLEVHGENGLLRSLAVEADYRDQGLGAALVSAAKERAEKLDLRAVYLLTTTAREFFAGHGFTDTARTEAPTGIRESWEFVAGCPTTAVLMKRALARA